MKNNFANVLVVKRGFIFIYNEIKKQKEKL